VTSDSTASDSTDTSVVVIGGGQAGLSVSYYLKRLGLDPGNEFVVLDRGPGTGGAWQFRWDALRIGSAHRINDLPGMDEIGISFSTADRTMPAKDVVADYYAQYEQHYGFQIVRSAAVSRVENAGDRMLVTFSDGEGEQVVSTDIVINATGTWGSPFIPWYPGRDSFAGRHVHTAEYADAAEFAGQKVVVVGGGTSAIGFLLELESVAASTTWVSRRPIEFLEDGELNLEARVSAVAMQDEAARAGRALPSIVSGTGVPRTRRIQAGIDRGLLAARPMFASIEPGGVRWSNGSFQEADAIIWSTGFRPELRHLAPLKLREREGGIIVAGGSSWKEPRIFFAGYGPQASTIGANRAGRSIARQAVATLSRLKRVEREERDARDEQQRLEERMRENAADTAAARAAAFVAAAEAERAEAERVAAAAAAAAAAQIPALVEPPARYPEPVAIESPADEPAQSEAVESAPAQSQPAQNEAAQSEPTQSEAPQVEAAQNESAVDPWPLMAPVVAPAFPAAPAESSPLVEPVPFGEPVAADEVPVAETAQADEPHPDETAQIDEPQTDETDPDETEPDDPAYSDELSPFAALFGDPNAEQVFEEASAAASVDTHLPWIAPAEIAHRDSSTATVWPLATGFPPAAEPEAAEPALEPAAAEPEPAIDPEAEGAELTPDDTEALSHLPELGDGVIVIDDPDSLSMAELLEHINAPEGMAMPEPDNQSPPQPVSAASHYIDAPHWFTDDHAPGFFDDAPGSAPDEYAPADSRRQPVADDEAPHFRSSFSPPEVDVSTFPGARAETEPGREERPAFDQPQHFDEPQRSDEQEPPHFRSSFSPPQADFPSFFGTLSVPQSGSAHDETHGDPDDDTNELTPGTPRTPRH